MQKKGEISEDRARARTEKYVPRYVDQVPLGISVSFIRHRGIRVEAEGAPTAYL